jgi:N-acetyl-anhydromuramyl-L-alanine amidase AmpD
MDTGANHATTIPKPPMVSRPSPNRGGYDPDEDGPRVAEAITYHIATSTISSNLGWLTNPASGASCNYYIGKDGTIYELVPWQEAAWTNGKVSKPDTSNALIAKWVRNGWNPNTRTISIEHEGEARDTLTAAQIASNNRLTAWLSQVAGIPISRTTIIGHYQIDSVDRPYCPSFSDAEWRALVDGANALLNVSQPQPEPAPTPDKLILPGQGSESPDVYPPDAGLQRGFKGVYLALGAAKYPDDPALGILSLTGWAKGDEFEGVDGCVYQRFHRVTLQYDPRNAQPWDIVQMHPDTPLPERKAA